jgi:inorganic triphosphatase YgiF
MGDNGPAMANEIELKLALPESAQRALLRHPLLTAATAKRSAQVVNIYYDTPGLELHRRGIALRLRRLDGAWLQTVKCCGLDEGGLTSRPEWETPYSGHFDFSAIEDEAVRDRLQRPRTRSRLAPLFETRFRRTTWQFKGVLVTLDRGWIVSSGRREAISEVELELAQGEVSSLFALAEQLAARVPLTPAMLSKADRGYRLYRQLPSAPDKAGELPLDGAVLATLPPRAVFRVIAFACLAHMQRNHAGAIVSDDPEYIHQMRVAVRRLRACLRLFAPLLTPQFADSALPPLRALMSLLGEARDLDVLLTEIVGPVVAALPDEPRLAALAGIITDRRHGARRESAKALQSPRYGQLMLRLAALLHEETSAGADQPVPLAAAGFAAEQLQRLTRKIRKLARAAKPGDPASLHALRIGIKRLRYALEFFAPLAHGKHRRQLASRLADVQGTLGQLNDLANAGRLLMNCAGDDLQLREAVSLIGGWHGPHHAWLQEQLPPLLAKLWRLSRTA